MLRPILASCLLLAAAALASATVPGQYRFHLNPSMVKSSAANADFSAIADEQFDTGDPPSGNPETGWTVKRQAGADFPYSATVELGRDAALATLWIYDTNGRGRLRIEAADNGAWRQLTEIELAAYKAWRSIPLNLRTDKLRLTVLDGGANFAEIALDAYSDAGWTAFMKEKAEQEKRDAERAAALAKAKEEAMKRPLATIAPFGLLSLVEEIDTAAATAPQNNFRQDPENASKTETILGRPARVLTPVPGEGAYMTYRVGRRKLLRPGAAYVLAIEYPEDKPRTFLVTNTGCETSRGFHTGPATGDALLPKYVNNHNESLDLPLSGKWENWTALFYLHDRFPETGLPRGSEKPRPLVPEDGFDVTIAHFSKENDPLSHGPAIGKIRLYEVVDPAQLDAGVVLPPKELPRRRIFWREEMADGVIGNGKKGDGGLDDTLDWYKFKAGQMKFLGINTYTKDLLEFGACQHWDSAPYGGNDWVYYNADHAGLWQKIVTLMASHGFDLLPYYEYSGSKGKNGLGPQRRAKPLTRDDAYTHIKWIESANADITDPDTYADFKKMLDATVIRFANDATFAGIWMRPRSQLPVSFGPAALKRFGEETANGKTPTRDQLKSDKQLYARYLEWWHLKRRAFLAAMRDHLAQNGVREPLVLFTGEPGEPGVGFGDWTSRFVTDTPATWASVFAVPPYTEGDKKPPQILTPAEVVKDGLYKKGLLSPGLNWGGWEIHHAKPADDPAHYADQNGLMLTHCFNRLYTVADPATMDLYRTPSGLAMVRHYSLNENMMFDKTDKAKMGYFIADIERAGPYCMMAEAVAMANGDPSLLGYLIGSNYGRGFPAYVRGFNLNFLALPALPSTPAPGAASDKDIVVRLIKTPGHGTYGFAVNTSPASKKSVSVKLPAPARVLVPGTAANANGATLTLDMHPYQLVSFHF